MKLFDHITEYRERTLAEDDRERRVSYGDLEVFARELYRQTEGRCLIAILCENTVECLMGYLGALMKGIVPLMADRKIHPTLLEHLLQEYRPVYVYGRKELFQDKKDMTPVWSYGEYVLCRYGDGAKVLLHEDLALLLTTSGSTGSPKLVRQSRANIEANTASIIEYLKINEKERPVTTLPMNYTYGLSIINSHVMAGATLLLTEAGVLERGFWEFVKEKGATSFGGVPYTYQMLKRIGFTEMELPELRTMTQAGGKLPVTLHREFASFAERTGKRFVVMYGQTEATARMGYLPPDKATEKSGAMGIAIPGGRFWLEDEERHIIEEPEISGELVYQGKNVCMGYAESWRDLDRGDEWNGVLRTGDMACRDIDGFYYITGRKKRFIKLFGSRVNLDEVERLLKEGFTGADFACTGRDDHLQIFTDMKNAGAERKICDYLYQMTGIKGRAVQIMFLPGIPKNSSGKTLYGELERMQL